MSPVLSCNFCHDSLGRREVTCVLDVTRPSKIFVMYVLHDNLMKCLLCLTLMTLNIVIMPSSLRECFSSAWILLSRMLEVS